jgi:hypothetical protein
MKKVLLMFALVGAFAFASCSASEETQKKYEEAQKQADKEAGEMPKFDDDASADKKEEPKKEEAKGDTAKKTEEPKKEDAAKPADKK